LRGSSCFWSPNSPRDGTVVTTPTARTWGVSLEGGGLLRGRYSNWPPSLLPIVRPAADLPRFVQLDLRRLLIFALNGFVHLATVHRNLARRFDSQPHLVAAHVDDGYDDIIANNDAFIAL